MSALKSIAATLASEPLALNFAVIAVGALVSRFLLRQHPAWRAIARVAFLSILTVLLLRAGVVPYKPLQSSGIPLRDAIIGILKVAWWLWGAWFLVALISSIVVFESRPREGKLLRDLLSALAYLAAIFAIIAYVFDLPIQGLLATSGAIAIILGLALQSTLNDVFSGLVLSLSRPFRPGDWINIEGSTEGQVVEMNWRATHVLTGRHDLAILPNSTISKSKIVNLNFPSGIHGIAETVRLACSPACGIAILEMALLNAKPILTVPRPTIRVTSIEQAKTEFEVTAFVEHLGAAIEAQNELFDLIYRHAAAAGIRLAAPKDQPLSSREIEDAVLARSHAERVLDIVPLFQTLKPEERAGIAKCLKQASYETGDLVVERGAVLKSLFFVGRGVLSAKGLSDGTETEVLRFGPGDHYGEIGLLTETAAGANITALVPSIVYELAKFDLTPILEARPQIAHELSHALAERQAAGRALAATGPGRDELHGGLSNWFLERIHRLLELEAAR
ncbi:MAG: mechanosensitive ion channel family protein [Hyphomicrobiales bacterium]|nr:mechanosensitive ion channel family protein [Hyphomicrobiales bacterium]